MRNREFDKLSDVNKVRRLLDLFNHAVQENEAMRKHRRTDVFGVAKQYGGNRIKKSDFDLIKNMTIEEISKLM